MTGGGELIGAAAVDIGKTVVTGVGASVWRKLAGVPPHERPGFDNVQPRVISSATEMVEQSAEVLRLVGSFDVIGDLFVNSGSDVDGFWQRASSLVPRHEEMRKRVADAAPIVEGLRLMPRRVVPRLDPIVEHRLASTVAWHGWTLGSLLDLADAAAARTEPREKDAMRLTLEDERVDPQLLGHVLMCHHALVTADTCHTLMHDVASQSIFTATGADKRTTNRARRQVGRDDDARRAAFADLLERVADGIDDAISPPSRASRASRSLRRSVRGLTGIR